VGSAVKKAVLVPIVVAGLGMAAISAIIVLQRRENDSRSAQLSLSMLETHLEALQSAPFDANAGTGGSPAFAAGLMRTGKAQIGATLANLRRHDPPVALQQLQVPLLANYATLDRIYQIGSTSIGYDAQADRLASVAAGSHATVAALLSQAGHAYHQRAQRADIEETVGAVATIVLLLGAFGFLYQQNKGLLESSRTQALSDALTGLRNRRALVADLAAGIKAASAVRPLLLGLLDLDGFKQYNDTFGHPAGDALLSRVSGRLHDALDREATVYRMGGDEFCLLATLAPGAGSEIVRRAARALSESGETFNITCSYGSALIPAEASSSEEALHLADQRMYAQKLGAASAGRQSSDVLLKVISERSNTLETHLGSAGQLARLLAQRLSLSEPEQRRIQDAAQLHDIGKTAMPDSLLNKPGPLSPEEWEFMRTHTVIGERILLAAPSLAQAAPLVRSSHERFDGTGYPDGLAGDQIPVGARIIAVCDAFDAMTSTRPYSKAISSTEALIELHRHAGTQFDPDVVEAFDTLAHVFTLGPPAADRPQVPAAAGPLWEAVGAVAPDRAAPALTSEIRDG
jgi:diguanylate cyclase (GGDEF)-like protein